MVKLGEMQFGRYVYDRFGIEYGILGGFHALNTDASPPLTLHTMHVLIPVTIEAGEQPRQWAAVTEIMFEGKAICEASIAPVELGYMTDPPERSVTLTSIARFENIQFDLFGDYLVRTMVMDGNVIANKTFYVGPSPDRRAGIARLGGTGVGMRR